jgi:hypothetical protein
MFDTTEAFLLGGRDQPAVAQERSRGIGVKRIESEDDQIRLRIILSSLAAKERKHRERAHECRCIRAPQSHDERSQRYGRAIFLPGTMRE